MFVATVDLKENVLHYANPAHLPPAAMVAPDILRVLTNMGFEDVFAMADENYRSEQNLADLSVAHDMLDTVIRKRVIEAFRVLMSMNEQNERMLKDLVEALQLGQEDSAKVS